MSRIFAEELLELNWLNINDRYLQFIESDIFKFHNSQYPEYFNKIFSTANDNWVATRSRNEN